MAYFKNTESTDKSANNPSTRIPVVLCLDTSGSMGTVEEGSYRETGRTEIIDGKVYDIVEGGTSRLDELQTGIKMFFDAIKDDEIAIDAAEIAIVTFDNSARIILPFNHIEDQKVPDLSCGGETHLGEGVNLALKILEERKEFYKKHAIQYYQPWMVLMTDGENNGNIVELQNAINKSTDLVKNKKLTIFPIGIGNEADMSTLGKFSPGITPLKLKGLKFKEFFQWLSVSVSRVSVSKPGDNVDLPPVGGWGTVNV